MKKIFTAALIFCSLISKAQTFTWSGYSLIDNSVNDTIVIPAAGLPDSITNSFGVSGVCFDIYHPSKTSLLILLVAPDGQSVLLMEGHGVVGESFVGTCLGMDGVPFELGTPPFTGNFLPSGDISTLNNGQNPNGNWKLIINNHHSTDTGSARFASITFSNNPPRGNGLGGNNEGPAGPFIWPGLVCPGGASSCDLLPDMTASAQHILTRYTEEAGRIKISNSTPNIGYGPMEIYGLDSCYCNGMPSPCNVACADGSELQHILRQRIYRKRPGTDTLDFYDRDAGFMTYHPNHGHLHVDDWGSFTLRTATSDPDPRNWPIIGTSVKQSYCLTNLGTCSGSPGECVDNNGNTILTAPNNGFGFQTGCDLTQGIFAGYLDVYGQSLNEPILLDNVCNGNYYLVSITDPDNKFLESDETNNWVAVPITLTRQNSVPAVTASSSPYLCGPGDSLILTANIAPSYHWSTGDSTNSIVVRDTGTYSVSTPCGISLPFTVSKLPANAKPAISIAIIAGSLPSCQGNSVTFKATPEYGGSTPVYQWQVDGVNVGTNSNTFTSLALTNSQKVSCMLTSSINCFIQPVYSDSITAVIAPIDSFTSVVIQTKGYNPFCIGDTVTFTASAASATNPVYHWKVDGTDAGTNSPEFTSSSLQHGQVITCTVTAMPRCGNNAGLGVSAGYNITGTTTAAAYPSFYGNGHQQYLIRASELQAIGLTAGSLTTVGFITGANIGNPDTLKGYSIKLATVPQTTLNTQMLTPTFTTVFGPVDLKPVINDTNFHDFATPYQWDGVSNLLIDICFASGIYGTSSYQNIITNTSFTSGTIYQRDYFIPAPCDTLRGTRTTTQRPYMLFAKTNLKDISSAPITIERLEPIYRFTGNGNWNIPANWLNSKMPPKHVLHCAEIIIDPVAGGECILNTSQVVAPGAKITVVAGKKFKVMGNVLVQE